MFLRKGRLIKEKFSVKESATSPLTTIDGRKYADILKKEPELFAKINTRYFVGIHMSEEGSISLAYAVNDENCRNFVVVE